MNARDHAKPAPDSRCPHCGQPRRGAASVPPPAPTPIKHYALESLFGIRRMNGGFV